MSPFSWSWRFRRVYIATRRRFLPVRLEDGLRHGRSDEVKSEAGQHCGLTSVQNRPHFLLREVAPKMNIFLQCSTSSKLSTAFRWGTWNGLIVATIPIDLAADSSYWTGMTGMTSNWQNTRLSHAIYGSFTPICKLSRQKVCLHLAYFHLTSRAGDVSTLRPESNERLGIFQSQGPSDTWVTILFFFSCNMAIATDFLKENLASSCFE